MESGDHQNASDWPSSSGYTQSVLPFMMSFVPLCVRRVSLSFWSLI